MLEFGRQHKMTQCRCNPQIIFVFERKANMDDLSHCQILFNEPFSFRLLQLTDLIRFFRSHRVRSDI